MLNLSHKEQLLALAYTIVGYSILLSYAYLYGFWTTFDINIFTHLSLTNIILLALPNIFLLTISSIGYLGIFIAYYYLIKLFSYFSHNKYILNTIWQSITRNTFTRFGAHFCIFCIEILLFFSAIYLLMDLKQYDKMNALIFIYFILLMSAYTSELVVMKFTKLNKLVIHAGLSIFFFSLFYFIQWEQASQQRSSMICVLSI